MGFLRRDTAMAGLDIGSAFVKAALVDHGSAAPRLVGLASCPVAANAIVEGEVLDPDAVGEAIRRTFSRLESPRAKVAVAVGGREVIVRRVRVDDAPDGDLPELIAWEAENVVPFEMDDVRLGHQTIGRDDGLKVLALVAAARNELVEGRIRLLESAGVRPVVVDVEAFALFNALDFGYPGYTRSRGALVNVGHETTTVIAFEDEAPSGVRELAFGSRQLRAGLSRLENLGPEMVDSILAGEARSPAAAARIIDGHSEDVARAIERTLATALELPAGGLTAPVFLSGGTAKVTGFAAGIARHLGVRVEVVTPFQRLEVAPEAVGRLPGEALAPAWMLSVGLALRNPIER